MRLLNYYHHNTTNKKYPLTEKNNKNLCCGHCFDLINFVDGLILSYIFFKHLFFAPFQHHYEGTQRPILKEKLLLNGFMGKFILLLHFIIISILFDLPGFNLSIIVL